MEQLLAVVIKSRSTGHLDDSRRIVYISWGFANRSALIRVPQYPVGLDKTTRIEYRHPDPS